MNYLSEEFMEDVALGMVSAGLPEAYHISKAIYERDTEALAYHLKVAGTVHGTWYTGYRLAILWDLYRHGGKNVISFHKAMQGVNALRGMVATAPSIAIPALVVGGVLSIAHKDHHGRKYGTRSDRYARRNRARIEAYEKKHGQGSWPPK